MPVIKHRHRICALLFLLSTAACTTSEHQTSSHQTSPADVIRVEAEQKSEDDQIARPAEKGGRAEKAASGVGPMIAKRTHPLPASASPYGADREALPPQNTEKYQHVDPHPIKQVMEHPVSTFSIDVDTGAYANVRRFLNAGQLPPSDAVRVEEMINYFPYSIDGPIANGEPFAVHVEVAPTPWNADTHLMRVALKGREVANAQLPPANLVFLIDVSGSMEDANKLPLLKQAFRALTRKLRPSDRVSLVVYAGASGVVLEPTAGNEQRQILAALDSLQAGGSTHGAAGIELAYRVARQAFIPGGTNRVLLATDGDFNVGITNFEHLKNLIERQRASGVALSTLGFGTGNYNDHLMEQLADAGNGNYSYIDTANEARKVLIDEFSSTMATIAKDVKIQVEFNPAAVAEYRLIGYDNRALRREDFNNDRVDAGEIGVGHTVTALYEIRLVGRGKSLVDPLRYQPAATPASNAAELAYVRLRYKLPGNEHSELMSRSVGSNQVLASFDAASEPLRFATAVAAFGQLLKGGHHLGSAPGFGYDDIVGLAREAIGNDPYGYRAEFTELVSIAHNLSQIEPQARNAEE